MERRKRRLFRRLTGPTWSPLVRTSGQSGGVVASGPGSRAPRAARAKLEGVDRGAFARSMLELKERASPIAAEKDEPRVIAIS